MDKRILSAGALVIMTGMVGQANTSYAWNPFDKVKEGIEKGAELLSPNKAEQPVETKANSSTQVEGAKPESAKVDAAKSDTKAIEAKASKASNSVAANMTVDNCIKASEADKKAASSLLFGDEMGGKGLVSKSWAPYLAGLCVPKDQEKRLALNEFLLVKGSLHSLYAERNLQDLATYLENEGIDLDLKIEAIEKDARLLDELKGKDNDISKAGVVLNQNKPYTKEVDTITKYINKLQKKKQDGALAIASKVREHAVRSSFYLSRGVYVSELVAEYLAGQAKTDVSLFADDLKSDKSMADKLVAGVGGLTSYFSGEKRATKRFTTFVASTGEALVDSLNNGLTIVESFETNLKRIPKLEQAALDEDIKRLNEEWSIPEDVEGEEIYLASNSE